MVLDPSIAFRANVSSDIAQNGREPILGGTLRVKAVWVDESICIGCRYCAHVATNTFIMEPELGRSRVVRQDGDSTALIQEAVDTCPVNCIHWVDFEELDQLKETLDQMEIQTLGMLPKVSRKIRPRSKK